MKPKVCTCKQCGVRYRPGCAEHSPKFCSTVCRDRHVTWITKMGLRMKRALERGLVPSH